MSRATSLIHILFRNFLKVYPNHRSACLVLICVEYYVKLTLGKTDFNYYVQPYGGDHHEIIERCCFEDTSVEDDQDPFELKSKNLSPKYPSF